ncbi:methyl-accepting chemotaxis protein [Aliivibrio wodanis]|uniref:Methyl-accepting chemotaxis protein n=1 Tax=Aliivibrio wodanis TaxID=80852 RepID=A0A090ITE4_9GAMM|nr:methyl-accepting chemotaxis protein [Aliivibrio wodanis]
MKFFDSIANKLVSSGVLFLILASSVTFYYITMQRVDYVENEVRKEVELVTTSAASSIKSFYSERARVVTTLSENTFMKKWFNDYDSRGSDIDSDPNYQMITSMFKSVSEQDPVIKSVFFSPANTYEYFDKNGRYSDTDYYTNKRPWWYESLDKNQLFINDPQIDMVDNSMVSSIKTTVYNDGNELIGVMGIDILSTEIKNEIIDNLKYNGIGIGFLFTANSNLIVFSDESSALDMSSFSKLSEVNNIGSGTKGFEQIEGKLAGLDLKEITIKYKGEEQLVFVNSVIDESIGLDWRIGFIVPKNIISSQTKPIVINLFLIAIATIAFGCLIMFFMINRLLTRPLNKVVMAMDDIAMGDGDLTRRLDESKPDELGKLSSSFNIFVTSIQCIIKQSRDVTNSINYESEQLELLNTQLGHDTSGQKRFLEQIATAATEMTQTISSISDNTKITKDYAIQAHMHSNQGQVLVGSATKLMSDLYQDVSTSEAVVNKLNENASSISSVLEVIKSVAEQTNLLALNAAIEAARAGEQGRGFAVVADEVRTLASRTQDSTIDIESIIETLQISAVDAVASMNVGRSKAEQGVELIKEVSEKLNQIDQSIDLIDKQSQEVSSMVQEQTVASHEISNQTVSVDNLAESIVVSIGSVSEKIAVQKEVLGTLSSTIGKFAI